MPHILVLGATGAIGSALAHSLLRSGNHTVYGLARTPQKAHQLTQQEIIPVLGSTSEPKGITDLLAQKPEVSVVIDAAAAYGESVGLIKLLVEAGRKRLEGWEKAGAPAGPKLGYVYVSGMWVHGDSPAPVSDINAFAGTSQAPSPAVPIVAWRPEIERMVLAPETHKVLDTAIARPAVVYGGGFSSWSGAFTPLLEASKSGRAGEVAVGLDAAGMCPTIHADDLGAGIAALAEKLPLLSGTGVYPVFDFVAHVEGLRAIVEGAARVFGVKGDVEFTGPAEGDVMAQAMSASTVGDSGRAKTLLGWEPKRRGMLHGIDVYAKAWAAGVEKK